MPLVRLQRDSVSMGDDVAAPHDATLNVENWSVKSIALAIINGRYLPLISGDKATWILRCGDDGGKPLAVLAQQWTTPQLLVSESLSLLDMACEPNPPLLFVQYYCQVDPQVVYHALQNSEPLPDPYGR